MERVEVFFKEIEDAITSKEELENLMISSNILFESREEIIKFFEMLLKFDLRDEALNYLEDLVLQIDDAELIDGFNQLFKK
jgi:hypothetical protein